MYVDHQVLTLTVQCNTGINVCRSPGTNTDCTIIMDRCDKVYNHTNNTLPHDSIE
jgi:hypothetical protein